MNRYDEIMIVHSPVNSVKTILSAIKPPVSDDFPLIGLIDLGHTMGVFNTSG